MRHSIFASRAVFTLVISLCLLFTCSAAALAAGPVYDVPASIDATGVTEVSTKLQQFLVGLPRGTASAPVTVRFASGGTYWSDYTLVLRKKGSGGVAGAMWNWLYPRGADFDLSHIRLDLNGATIHQRTTIPFMPNSANPDYRKRWGDPIIATLGASDVEIFGGTIRGSNPTMGYKAAKEEWAGVKFAGSDGGGGVINHLYLYNMNIQNVWGDYVYLSAPAYPSTPRFVGDPRTARQTSTMQDVKIVNNKFDLAGRQGIVLNGGTNVLIADNDFRRTTRVLIDSEPTRAQGWSNVTISNNTANVGGLGFFRFGGAATTAANHLTITNNRIGKGHMQVFLSNADTAPREGFVMTGNTSLDSAAPYAGSLTPAMITINKWTDVGIANNTDWIYNNGKRAAVRLSNVPQFWLFGNCWWGAIDNQC